MSNLRRTNTSSSSASASEAKGISTSSPPSPKIEKDDQSSWSKLATAYIDKTPKIIKAIDAYLAFAMVTGILLAIYLALTRGRNFESFLGGFISCVGSFVLAASVRLQANIDKMDVTVPPRAVAEFVLGHILLNILVANYI